MQKGLIGVIVPVYKVEKYIAECIESILAQTYTKFRLILIDDGTPDTAGKICDEYAKKDPRITVIHQENAGVTRARARGVEEAKDCEFITFVDGDDTIVTTALHDLQDVMNDDTDIVITNRILEYQNIEETTIGSDLYQSLMITEKISCAPWSRLFRRALFNTHVFNISKDIIVAEDLIMNIRLSLNSHKHISVLHKHIYNYRIHEECITSRHKETHELYFKIYSELKKSYNNSTLEIHINDIIHRFLERWDRMFGYSYKVPQWHKTAIHEILLADIKRYNYTKNFIAKTLLSAENSFLRFILITIRKVSNKISDISNGYN